MTDSFSKPLGSEDSSAVDFVIELLKNDPTFGINFDRVQWDNEVGQYVIIEFLLCHERQFPRGITPYSSHPNRYFDKNAQKFISLWAIATDLQAKLYLVNYSKKGTEFENEVLLMEVLDVIKDNTPPVKTEDRKFTREEFSIWFRRLNARGVKR